MRRRKSPPAVSLGHASFQVAGVSRQASRRQIARKSLRLIQLIAEVTLAAALCGAAHATSPTPRRVELPAQDLAGELNQLAQQTGIELLVDKNVVVHRRGPAVHGLLTPERALARVLDGSGLTFRQTPQGAFVVVAASPSITRASPPAKQSAEVGAVAEILVTGRRSLNVDIPRSQDDIQPYTVATGEVIAQSQAQTAEEFLRNRLPDNTAFPASIQEPAVATGDPTSQVDLRGLGIGQTLVLLDGRRLPTISLQPDLNSIPPSAIERIETLTSAAGGIYGPDAIGGVVNVVLKRDYQGAELNVSSGVTARGDDPQWRADGSVGATNAVTGTQVMLSFSHAETAGLTFGDRDFVEAAHLLTIQRSFDGFLPPVASQVNVLSADGSPLTLTAGLGGGSLGSTMTHLPFGVALTGAPNEAALLRANAGAYDLSLSPDGQGAQQSLLTSTVTNSAIFSVRQPIGPRLEVFLDMIYGDDHGTATVPLLDTANALVAAGAPGNPFQNDIFVSFPTPGLSAKSVVSVVTERASLGVIAHLGAGWTGDLDLTLGESTETSLNIQTGAAITVTPFAGPAALAAALAANQPQRFTDKLSDHTEDLNLRLGGPLLQLPAGPLTMTLLGEFRNDRPPLIGSLNIDAGTEVIGQVPPNAQEITREQVVSAYAEARAPLVGKDSAWLPLRGLELQLALRADSSSIRNGVPSSFVVSTPQFSLSATDRVLEPRTTTASVTVGARVSPIEGVTLRGSFATGHLPIAANSIASSETDAPTSFGVGLSDPRRGGEGVGTLEPVTLENLGTPNPKQEFAQTMSFGVILTPNWAHGLRLSIDYTRTDTSLGTTTAGANLEQFLLDNEASYPGRIVRAPLTAADAAMGDLAGVVTMINFSPLNVARSSADSIAIQLDYSRDTPVGAFHLYGQAVWEPTLRFLSDPTLPSYNLVGDADGPLEWRGNVGADWRHDRWTAGVNAQVFSGYRESLGLPLLTVLNQNNLLLQGAASIPPQVYVDAIVGYRSTVHLGGAGSQDIEYRFGVQNLFDQTPPLIVAPPATFETVGYSTYGDPRGRRFEFTVTARF
jgi:iron complex outermembrane recepter protein